MSDLISRQAAIDAILAVTGNLSVRELYEHVQEHGLSDMWSGGVNAAIDIIIAVPSAQPEIIRCKECKHFHYDMPYIIQGIPVLGHEVCDAWGDGCKTDENGYCFLAERRTDE